MNRPVILVTIGLLSGCATAPPATPPQAMFVGESVPEVTGKLVSICMDRGYEVMESSNTHVLCETRATSAEDMMYRSLMVGSGGTPTVKRIRFSMASVPEGVRVMGSLNLQSQQVFGQVKSMPVTDAKTREQIRSALLQAGGI